jgi:hypothetical protein
MSKQLYHIRNRDEDYENNPFVMAETIEEAYEKIKKDETCCEYINDEYRNDGDLFITGINTTTLEVTFYYWNENLLDWDIDTTNIITP